VSFFFQTKPEKSAGPLRRVLHYALYDWTRDMSRSSRLLTTLAFLIQLGGLVFALIEPRTKPLMLLALLIYLTGLFLMNGTLTSEFVRKTQLEADQIAAKQIQQTLHPQKVEELPGYRLDTFYKPLRSVGGDYFDVIALPNNQTLFAIADVSGKGMPAALLAANIQALVRSISSVTSDPLSVANHVNHHLCHHTPPERFATAVFALLSHETGEIAYVNAGQNPPILSSLGRTTFLESTGIPLGLAPGAQFQSQRVFLPSGGKLLFFTDGLTDGIGGQEPEERVCEAIRSDNVITSITSLLNPKFNEDDITILLLTRFWDGSPQ
jgi:serine phosphatase RsbU (regulator of sigma subunit)